LGVGSSAHLNMEMLGSMAGIKLTPVHYRGGAPALTDVIGGHVPMMFISTTLMAQPWKAGQLKALAVGSAKRLPEFPDLPTVAESGLPGFEAVSWFGFFAPRGTPADVMAKINADVQSVLAETSFREKVLGPNYYEPITGSPAEFAAFVAKDAAKWSKVIKDAKITAE
jgi:tripartite-type tricarboxylate transporter receptor subunit TctC